VRHVALELFRDLIRLGPPEPALIIGLAVPARPQHDLEANAPGDVPDRERVLGGRDVVVVSTEPARRLVHQRDPAGLLVERQLPVGELGVVQHAVPPENVACQVQEDVLVDQREPEIPGRYRPGHRHDGRHRSSRCGVEPRRAAGAQRVLISAGA
jgi:hypothetical protein